MTDAELREIAERMIPDAFQQLKDGKWVECSHFVAFGWGNVMDDECRALYAFPPRDQLLAHLDRLARAEKALEPFARVAEADIGESETDAERFAPMLRHNRAPHITVGDMRNALAALTKDTSNDE
jgi:hypothetical protein